MMSQAEHPMSTAETTLTDFLLARIAEDEAWARGAIVTPGASHWHWVDADTDQPVTVDPMLDEYIDYPADSDSRRVDLRTVEELKATNWEGGGTLPDWPISHCEEVRTAAAGHIARHDPARVLAECEAKRRIIAARQDQRENDDDMAWIAGDVLLKILAAVYADHPDYREEWA